jgi:four helix bundle protein
MATYHDLVVYKNSCELANIIHKISLKLPKDLIDISYQIRRCSKSIPTNIAEGYGRCGSVKERINFLRISLGSNDEMIVHLNFIKSRKCLEEKLVVKIIEAYVVNGKRLNNLIKFNKKIIKTKTSQPENQLN